MGDERLGLRHHKSVLVAMQLDMREAHGKLITSILQGKRPLAPPIVLPPGPERVHLTEIGDAACCGVETSV